MRLIELLIERWRIKRESRDAEKLLAKLMKDAGQ